MLSRAADSCPHRHAFRRIRGRERVSSSLLRRYGAHLPTSGPGGQDSYYYFAGGPSTVRNRQRNDLYTLEYSGHHCISFGMQVSTITFAYHACTPRPRPSAYTVLAACAALR